MDLARIQYPTAGTSGKKTAVLASARPAPASQAVKPSLRPPRNAMRSPAASSTAPSGQAGIGSARPGRAGNQPADRFARVDIERPPSSAEPQRVLRRRDGECQGGDDQAGQAAVTQTTDQVIAPPARRATLLDQIAASATGQAAKPRVILRPQTAQGAFRAIRGRTTPATSTIRSPPPSARPSG